MAMTVPVSLSSAEALLEMTLLNAEQEAAEFDGIAHEALNRGIPAEIVTRLLELWRQTKLVAGELVVVGKIIVRKIMDFLLANPKMTIGFVLGAAVSSLVGSIPFIGPLLAPLAFAVSTTYGAGIGSLMQRGEHTLSPVAAAVEAAYQYFALLAAVFNGIADYWTA